MAVSGAIGPASPAADAAPTFSHQCVTAYQGQTYELDFSLARDDTQDISAGRQVQGVVTVLDPDSLVFSFQGVTRRGTESVVVDTPAETLYKSVSIARVTTDSYGTRGSAIFRRLHRPFTPDIARLTLAGTAIDFACDLSQFMQP
jgi:hypothetical protein